MCNRSVQLSLLSLVSIFIAFAIMGDIKIVQIINSVRVIHDYIEVMENPEWGPLECLIVMCFLRRIFKTLMCFLRNLN